MKILLQEPNGPYKCTIDTEVMQVTLTEVFLGVKFETNDEQMFSVCMRDDGFEVRYYSDTEIHKFDSGWIEFKRGLLPNRLQTEKD